MDLQTYREMKESGMTAENTQPDVQDAAVYEEPDTYDDPVDVTDDPEEDVEDTVTDDLDDTVDPTDDEEDIELPEAQKTAFQKALEREKRKLAEREEQLKKEYEEQYNPYKSFFDQLGVDPATAQQAIERNRIQQQVEQLAYEQGWTDDQAQAYLQNQLEQQRQAEELHDLRVTVQISELADKPEFSGIKQMKDSIKQLIKDSGGKLTAEQAYWAIGGPDRAKQLQREAQQREIAKRAKAKRTVQADNPVTVPTEKPLSPDVKRAAVEAGISEKEARRLMDMPNDLESYRKWKSTQNQRRA
ncbi:hypothetical protein [Paenibacillus sp. DMB20]|uniref:hypothetical protein n=1 Tax=Paenibacillus sp. DMB20 TaxID=1642570 RepID=UPI0006275FA0|nr:hypothetical protein [Paenibacillus sp. DMB20]KKO51148.1 hypothetical protein XI25_29620 [Paenibacillus sp. DMB20]